jgi:hypothetical protein
MRKNRETNINYYNEEFCCVDSQQGHRLGVAVARQVRNRYYNPLLLVAGIVCYTIVCELLYLWANLTGYVG